MTVNLLENKRIKYIKKYKSKTIILGLVLLFLLSPLREYGKSIVVMGPYSGYERSRSLMATEDITLKMPGGNTTLKKDWYPFVITFNDDRGLSYVLERDVRLTILYNFGAFDLLKGSSTFYDENSDYLNAFYGAYIVKDEEQAFAYHEDGSIDLDEIEVVPRHDMKNLVLYSIGLDQPVFDGHLDQLYKKDELFGYKGWDVIETTVVTNSPMHRYEKFHQAYIQYGNPWKVELDEEFREMTLKGRAYARHFSEKQVTVVFYILAGSNELVEYTDEKFIQKANFNMN